jgi:predicted dehydrogenase
MFKVAVVGTGLIATRKHLPAWKRLGRQARVVALCELDRQRGETVAAEFGVPNVHQDLGELLEAQRPDIVDICTPPKSHAALSIQALEGGAHLLIEKPMAVTTQECDQIIEAAERTRRRVCVAHSDLFYPAFVKCRRLVERGAIGTFRGMHVFLCTPVSYITEKADHWAHKLPGGVIGETGPHVVYMTLAFINPIDKVMVHGEKVLTQYPWSPYEDYRIILAGRQGVCSATLAYTTSHWAGHVDVWGSDGLLRADLQSQTLIRHERPQLSPARVGISALGQAGQAVGSVVSASAAVITKRFQSTHESLMRDLCRSLSEGTPVPVTAQEGRESVRVLKLLADQLELPAG